jgi:hypothetical protein
VGIYAYSSSHDKVDAIRIPFLALKSDDDPIAQCAPEGHDRNEWFTLVVTRGGGHMGWFQSGGAANRWARCPALEWFKATGEGIRLEPRKVKLIELRDDWLEVAVGTTILVAKRLETVERLRPDGRFVGRPIDGLGRGDYHNDII